MIYTSNYENAKKGNLVSVSMDGGKLAGFKGQCIQELAPKELFYNCWQTRKLTDPEEYYFNQYYLQVLKKNKFIIEDLIKKYGGNQSDIVLLSYALPDEFSHRQLISMYLKAKYGVDAPETIIDETDGHLESCKRPSYYPYFLEKTYRLVRTYER